MAACCPVTGEGVLFMIACSRRRRQEHVTNHPRDERPGSFAHSIGPPASSPPTLCETVGGGPTGPGPHRRLKWAPARGSTPAVERKRRPAVELRGDGEGDDGVALGSRAQQLVQRLRAPSSPALKAGPPRPPLTRICCHYGSSCRAGAASPLTLPHLPPNSPPPFPPRVTAPCRVGAASTLTLPHLPSPLPPTPPCYPPVSQHQEATRSATLVCPASAHRHLP